MFRKGLVVAFAVVASTTAAQAADFAGAYAGVSVNVDNFNGSGSAQGIGFSGAGVSGFTGYDVALGQGFIGAEANIDLDTADAQGVEAEWGWGVGARAGLKLNESTAVYGRAGYQRTRFEVIGDKSWSDGVRFGGGIETGLAPNTAVRVEFNHINYEGDVVNNQASAGILFRF